VRVARGGTGRDRPVRGRVADPAFPPDRPGTALDEVTADITASRNLNERRERTYPRVWITRFVPVRA
jgi:hypothetical protein